MPRILVVDDDRILRAIAAQALTVAGHQVYQAADAQEGLNLAREHIPDLIVCDVVMPGMNGFEFVMAVRQEQGIAGIPVIMLTSMSDRAQMRIGMNAGADDYLAKPFSFDELNDAVTALLAKRRTLQEGLISSMNTSFVAALEEQREALASQYERRLMKELGDRWEEGARGAAELKYVHAVVLKADIVTALAQWAQGSAQMSATIRKAHDAARDAVHLFNAAHVLPAGNDILAVYVDEPGSVGVSAGVRAVKAALGLVKALSHLRGDNAPGGSGASVLPAATVGLHAGPVTVLRMSDPLHGGPDTIVAAGDAVRELDAICELARASMWPVAASPTLVGGMAGQLVTGRTAQVKPVGVEAPLDVLEVLSLR